MSTTKWLFAAHAHAQGDVAEAMRYLEAAQHDDPEAFAALRVMRTKAQKHSTAVRFNMERSGFCTFIDGPAPERRIDTALAGINAHANDLATRWQRIAEGLGA